MGYDISGEAVMVSLVRHESLLGRWLLAGHRVDTLCFSILPRGTSNRRSSCQEAAEACHNLGLPLDSFCAGLSRIDHM